MTRKTRRSRAVTFDRRRRSSPLKLLIAGFGVLVLVLLIGMIVSALLRDG
jgi:hypothetical protein